MYKWILAIVLALSGCVPAHALSTANRVKETTTTTGTGTISLSGTITGYQAFSAAFAAGASNVPYLILDASGNWECGVGTTTVGPDQLQRTTCTSNSAHTEPSKINFGAGTKTVYLSINSENFTQGTVTSVAMTGDNVIFESAVTGSPITSSGTLVPALKTQTAKTFLCGPTSAPAAAPTFRIISVLDLPPEAIIDGNLSTGMKDWFLTTTSANLRTTMTDESGTGALLFANGAIGNATATTINKVTITAPATGSTLTIQDGFTLTATANATVSGTNTGDQTITLTGDVTGSGTGSFATTIGNLKVTNAMIAASTIDLTAKVTGILPSANGGTANGFTKFSGPAGAEKTFTLPNASATILTDNAAVTVPQGGTGNTTFTAYSVITAGTTATGAFQNVSGVGTSGQVLTSNGAAALPTWQAASGGGASRIRPGGRLTLTTATPVTTSNVTGATTVYYALHVNDLVPVYDGSTWTPTAYTELSQATTDATKSPAACTTEACYDMFVWSDGGTMRCTRGPAWSNTATITVTIATPAVVTWTGHGLHEGSPVIFTTTGALPTGITASTTYYVGRSPAANTFNISTSIANAAAGTFVATSGSQSGTHTGTNRDSIRGTGAGTSELERINGIWMNKNAVTNGPAADRGVYVGTIRTDTSSQANDSDSRRNVWNMYNRVPSMMKCSDSTDSWTYTSATVREANGSSTVGTSRVEIVVGLSEDTFKASNSTLDTNSGGGIVIHCGVGVNATNTNSDQFSTGVGQTIGTAAYGTYIGYPGIGCSFICRTESSTASGTTTWYGDAGVPSLFLAGMFVEGLR